MNAYCYDCPRCRAAGELRLVEGETLCPGCGEHLWTVRPGALTAGPPPSERLTPDRRLPMLDGRPPLRFQRYWRSRLTMLLFRPIIFIASIPWQRKMVLRVEAKMDALAGCRRRDQLEALIGPPVYAVNGQTCAGIPEDSRHGRPDVIECYESDGCCFDLWFKDERLIDTSGFVKPTVWDYLQTGRRGR